MIYEVSHRTVYRYSQPVSISHHLLHLTPRDGANHAAVRVKRNEWNDTVRAEVVIVDLAAAR